MSDNGAKRSYSPALGVDWLLPLYDPLLRAVIPEQEIKERLVALGDVRAGDRVLDLGCGTATLSLIIKQAHPDARVVGLDADARAIERATQKALRQRVAIDFDVGLATALPYADASVDRVFSAFVFHHLSSPDKLAAMREVRRVLTPAGLFGILDFGRPPTRFGRLLSPLLHPGRYARDNIRGRLPEIMREAGFPSVHEAARRTLLVGSVSFLLGRPS